jgi:RimJ/RimL family protein N-acetyltransferase
LAAALEKRRNGLSHPLVYRVNGEVAGITSLMRLDPANRSLEIGFTWVAPRWRRTFVNSRVKYCLLQYCFESLAAERVEFRVDARNTRSQNAVLRLGATFEGRLRNRQVFPEGQVSDGFLYSIVRPDWNRVGPCLLRRSEGGSQVSAESLPYLPLSFGSPRLELRRYEVSDARSVFELVDRNRGDLAALFPRTVQALPTLESAEPYLMERHYQWNARSVFCYGVFLRETGALIGQLQFKDIDWSAGNTELGYFLDADFRRRGFGREMATAALELVLHRRRFHRVVLRILPSNTASLKLAKALGFEWEGCHRREFLTGAGSLEDILYFSRVEGAEARG